MNTNTLAAAIRETERFLKLAKNVKTLESGWIDSPSKETAAAKRASLDLTRALAAMRKSN